MKNKTKIKKHKDQVNWEVGQKVYVVTYGSAIDSPPTGSYEATVASVNPMTKDRQWPMLTLAAQNGTRPHETIPGHHYSDTRTMFNARTGHCITPPFNLRVLPSKDYWERLTALEDLHKQITDKLKKDKLPYFIPSMSVIEAVTTDWHLEG